MHGSMLFIELSQTFHQFSSDTLRFAPFLQVLLLYGCDKSAPGADRWHACVALCALTTPISMSDALTALHSQSQVALAQQRQTQQQPGSERLSGHADA
jgi:hypothetical protein